MTKLFAIQQVYLHCKSFFPRLSSSPAFPDSASVDWPGWCFEADEVLDQLTPEDSGVGVDEEWWEAAEVGLSQTLTLRDFQRIGTQEDGTISQV